MLPVIWSIIRNQAPYIVWPFSAIIGFIGYKVEKAIRGDLNTPNQKNSIADVRLKRQLGDLHKEESDIKSTKSEYGIFKDH